MTEPEPLNPEVTILNAALEIQASERAAYLDEMRRTIREVEPVKPARG